MIMTEDIIEIIVVCLLILLMCWLLHIFDRDIETEEPRRQIVTEAQQVENYRRFLREIGQEDIDEYLYGNKK